jgi:uncharacterized protein
MRASCYLNSIEIGDGTSLLYNGSSMCIDAVPSTIARQLIDSVANDDLSFLTADEKKHLIGRGHLTPLTVEDEYAQMDKLVRAIAKRDVELGRQPFDDRIVSFILTYRCNLSCTYCFQDDIRRTSDLSSMSETFVDDFFHIYLDKLFPNAPRNRLRFVLFGGEPLLPGNRRTIERILGYAKECGAIVSTTTNGVTLPRMLDLMGSDKGKIQSVQVTLDGDQAFHDSMRTGASGAPTFDDTIRSVRELMRMNVHTMIRIHLHPAGLAPTRALVDYLDREGVLGNENVEVYFAPVHSFHAEEISRSDLDAFDGIFRHVTFRQKHPPIQNFDFLQEIMDLKTARNWSQPRYCAVSAGLHFAIDPFGDVYECLEEAGSTDRRVGILSKGEIEYTEIKDLYKGRYLLNMPGCLKCSIALFCGGGCISRTRTQGGAVPETFCAQNRVFIGQTLKACFLLKQGKEGGTGADPC